MKRRTQWMLIALMAVMALPLAAQKPEVIEKKYEKMDALRLDLVLGECRIVASDDAALHIRLEYTYDQQDYEPRFRERSGKLIVEEKFFGNNPQGDARWEIKVPKGTGVDFKSATGDLTLEGVALDIEGESGTGEMEVIRCSGRFELRSGTGSVRAAECQGEFRLQSGTGDVVVKTFSGELEAGSGTGNVKAEGLTIEMEAELHSGTGDVWVKAPKGSDFDLSLASGTGDAELDMGGQPIQGYYEMRCNQRRGRIRCDVAFDEEKETGRDREVTLVKSFTKGGKSPRYTISTGTGRAVLTR